MTLLGPTQQALMKVTEIKENNRADKHFNHLSEVAEGIPALAWVTLVSPCSACPEVPPRHVSRLSDWLRLTWEYRTRNL